MKLLTLENTTSASYPVYFASQHEDNQQMLDEYTFICLMAVVGFGNITKDRTVLTRDSKSVTVDKVSYLVEVDKLKYFLLIELTSISNDNTFKVDVSTSSTKHTVSKYLMNLHANQLHKLLDVIDNKMVLNKWE